MDHIEINQLSVYAHHGVFPEEKTLGQTFIVSAKLYLDLALAAQNDDLTNTCHYGLVAEDIQSFLQAQSFDLIETCAHRLAESLLQRYPLLREVAITIQKPSAPIPLPLHHVSVHVHRTWQPAVIALGSNMGDSESHLNTALTALRSHPNVRVQSVSSFYQTAPEGYLDQKDFINAACLIETLFSPTALLTYLQALEQQAGRKRDVQWGPRTLDLDLIYYDTLISHSPALTLPHPRAHERTFVLEPLAEIAPNYVDPRFQLPVSVLCQRLKSTSS